MRGSNINQERRCKRPYRLSARRPVATPVLAHPVRRSNVQTVPPRMGGSSMLPQDGANLIELPFYRNEIKETQRTIVS